MRITFLKLLAESLGGNPHINEYIIEVARWGHIFYRL
jgi:hypothetical protein